MHLPALWLAQLVAHKTCNPKGTGSNFACRRILFRRFQSAVAGQRLICSFLNVPPSHVS